MVPPSISLQFSQRVIVGIGELSVSNNPTTTLSTYALGSCVGIAAYDPVARAGGLLHCMLPSSSIDPKKAAQQPAMFADTGLPLLFQSLLGLPADRTRLRFLIAGGASALHASDEYRMGDRNSRVTIDFLTQNNLVVRYTEIGGTVNRTLHFEVGTGALTVKAPTGTHRLSLAT